MIFDSLHHKSRVWVYISSKPLTSYTKNKITCSFNDFKSSWKSHGETLLYTILMNLISWLKTAH